MAETYEYINDKDLLKLREMCAKGTEIDNTRNHKQQIKEAEHRNIYETTWPNKTTKQPNNSQKPNDNHAENNTTKQPHNTQKTDIITNEICVRTAPQNPNNLTQQICDLQDRNKGNKKIVDVVIWICVILLQITIITMGIFIWYKYYVDINDKQDLPVKGDKCSSFPCKNGATCDDDIHHFACMCSHGYTGHLCQTGIDECSSSPCQNGGRCLDGINQFSCICTEPIYRGHSCEIVDGRWGEWGSWSSCSKHCGSGTRNRIRQCNDPAPTRSGDSCDGEASETKECHSQCNEIDECSSSPCQNGGRCLDGINQFSCICTEPIYRGHSCEIVDGRWGEWGSWSSCSKHCGSGTRNRIRQCNDPAPTRSGDSCDGEASETKECHSQCNDVGSWTRWTGWSSWNVYHQRSKVRLCTMDYGLEYCLNATHQSQACTANSDQWPSTCSLTSEFGLYRFLTQNLTWSEAKHQCSLLGASLVTIETKVEQGQLVLHLVNTQKLQSQIRFWIGLNDIEKEGEYRWDKTGEMASYTYWGPNQPNSYWDNEDCVVLEFSNRWKTWGWTDKGCHRKEAVICEFDIK